MSIVHYVYEENQDESKEENDNASTSNKPEEGFRVVHVNHKFVMFDGCSMAGDVSLSDITQGTFHNPLKKKKSGKNLRKMKKIKLIVIDF